MESHIKFTEEQRKVIYHGEGPLLVVAGAGTGKTMCIAHRVCHLITEKKAEPEEILVLTFSEKAATEMEERIDNLLPYAFSDIWVSTFHSFGKRILQMYALEAGIPPNFRVLKPEEVVLFLKEHLFEISLKKYMLPHNPIYYLSAIAKLISRLKDEDISPKDYENFAKSISEEEEVDLFKKEHHTEMARVYGDIENLMRKKGFVDMADLVYIPLQLLRNNPPIAHTLKNKFKYILVDEFQDTNYAQYQILKILSSHHGNITVVGDDDQSIYKFRGAAISNILTFLDDFPQSKRVVLRHNFRSPQRILDCAYRLIRHNNPYRLEVKYSIDKRLLGREDAESTIVYKIFDTESSQAEEISKIVLEKTKKGYKYKDIAVLIRSNKNAQPIMQEFNYRGIPYTFSGNIKLFSKPEVKMLISFFKILTSPYESMSLFNIATSPIYQINPQTLLRVNAYADHHTLTLEEAIEEIIQNSILTVPQEELEKMKKLKQNLDFLRKLIHKLSAGRILYEFLSVSGFLSRLYSMDLEDADRIAKNIATFFEIIRKFEEISEDKSAISFSKYIQDLAQIGEDPTVTEYEEDTDAVSILTVHKAKGLEFPIVIIAGLSEGNFPSKKQSSLLDVPDELVKERMISPDFHIQEERRLCYVAITRAKKDLYMFGARQMGGGKRPKKVSRFIMEAFDVPIKSIKTNVSSPIQKIEAFSQKEKAGVPTPVFSSQITPIQIDDYDMCPLKYRFVHILRVPILPHHQVSYGKAIRESIMFFLKRKSYGLPVLLEDVWKIFEEEWSQEGFLSQKHEEMRFREGKEALKIFCEKFQDFIQKGDLIDKEYTLHVGDTKITGRWDLVRPSSAMLYDFRASFSDEKNAKRKARDSFRNQISIFAFYKIYKKLPSLYSYFTDSGVTGVVKPSEKYIEKISKRIEHVLEGIAKGEFSPTPRKHKCSLCAYREICPSA